MNVPRVSVVMSVFNGQPFLGQAVESILNQTFTDLEFIVIDDGSTDDTWETLARYAEQDQRLVLLRNQPNIGVVRSLNRGLEAARGEFVVRQDADDVSLPQRIEKQVAFLDAHPEVGVVGTVPQIVSVNGASFGANVYTATQNEEIQHRLLDHMCLCGPSIAVRKECFRAAGFYFSEGLDASEDYDVCLRLAEVTQMASLAESLYQYRQHPNSASRTREQKQMFNKAVALERAICRRFGPVPPQEQFATAARDYMQAAIIGMARNDLKAGRTSLSHALVLYPPLLETDEPLESLVRAYTPSEATEAALAYTESIFRDLLPHTQHLSRLESRLISYLHMSEVFAGAEQNQRQRIKAHLWPGLRRDPTWLLNRGVISILIKSLFRRDVSKAGQVD
jgi:glycosyltransferase involved in cell wall biosynthesis